VHAAALRQGCTGRRSPINYDNNDDDDSNNDDDDDGTTNGQ
jgi:hypothetical protein